MTRDLLAALALVLAAPAMAQSADGDWPAPERTATGQALVSRAHPAVRIALPRDAVYVGAVRWALYDVADAELHAFVVADEHALVSRFWWVQFEAYLPSVPQARYDYAESNPETTTIGDYTVHVSPGIGRGANHGSRPGSDSAAFRTLLAEHGYRLPAWMASVRFVHLPTHDRREELMIIYGENMDASVEAMVDAQEAGAEGMTWQELAAPLIERGRESITLEPLVAE